MKTSMVSADDKVTFVAKTDLLPTFIMEGLLPTFIMEGNAIFQPEDSKNKDEPFFPCMFITPLNSIHKPLRSPDQEILP